MVWCEKVRASHSPFLIYQTLASPTSPKNRCVQSIDGDCPVDQDRPLSLLKHDRMVAGFGRTTRGREDVTTISERRMRALKHEWRDSAYARTTFPATTLGCNSGCLSTTLTLHLSILILNVTIFVIVLYVTITGVGP